MGRSAAAVVLPPVALTALGGERTFNEDISSGPALRAALDDLIEIVWARIAESETRGRTVTLKLKYTDFQLMTRAKSLPRPVEGKAEFARLSRGILDEILPLPMPVRLMGLTLSNLEGEETDERPPDTAQLSLL